MLLVGYIHMVKKDNAGKKLLVESTIFTSILRYLVKPKSDIPFNTKYLFRSKKESFFTFGVYYLFGFPFIWYSST